MSMLYWESIQQVRVAQAELAAARGDVDGACRIFEDTVRLLGGRGWDLEIAQTRMAYGEVLLAAGRSREARPILEAARDFYKDPLAFRRREQVQALLAKCEAAVG